MVAQIVFYFLMGVLFASPIGVASYFLLRWLRRTKPSWLVFVDYLLAILSLLFFNISMVLLIPLCLVTAYASRSTEGRDKASFYDFVKALSAVAFPQLLISLVVLGIAVVPPSLYSSLSAFLVSQSAGIPQEAIIAWLCGAYLGLIVSPCVVPIAVWVRSSSRLQPGVDRLFAEGESIHPEPR